MPNISYQWVPVRCPMTLPHRDDITSSHLILASPQVLVLWLMSFLWYHVISPNFATYWANGVWYFVLNCIGKQLNLQNYWILNVIKSIQDKYNWNFVACPFKLSSNGGFPLSLANWWQAISFLCVHPRRMLNCTMYES